MFRSQSIRTTLIVVVELGWRARVRRTNGQVPVALLELRSVIQSRGALSEFRTDPNSQSLERPAGSPSRPHWQRGDEAVARFTLRQALRNEACEEILG